MEQIKGQRDEVEQHIAQVEDATRAHVENLENCNWRNNICLVGLKEGREQPGKTIQYVEKILAKELSGMSALLLGSFAEHDKLRRTMLAVFL